MTAPEKIAIKPCNPCHGDGDWYIALTKGGTEYTRSDMIAALEAAAEERGRIAGLREAANSVKDSSEVGREKLHEAYEAGDRMGYETWSAVVAHLDIEHDAILARIPATQSDEAPK